MYTCTISPICFPIFKLVQSELKEDKTFFKGLDKVKNDDISNYDLDRKLTEYIGILEQIKLDYSDLANNKGFKELLSESKKINEKLQAAKSYYNKYTSELNGKCGGRIRK